MAIALDQQFKIEKKGIQEQRIPILVNILSKKPAICSYLIPICRVLRTLNNITLLLILLCPLISKIMQRSSNGLSV